VALLADLLFDPRLDQLIEAVVALLADLLLNLGLDQLIRAVVALLADLLLEHALYTTINMFNNCSCHKQCLA